MTESLGQHLIYFYKGNIYTVLGKIKSKNSINGEWEEHYLYQDDIGNMYTRECKDFESKFVA